MSNPTDRLTSIRTFAAWTSQIAKALDCPYEDAAVFLTKMSTLVELSHDADFQAKLARYAQATTVTPDQPTPQGPNVH